jgi:dTDP-4-amino-4,6-dideoxygalactose transaminase
MFLLKNMPGITIPQTRDEGNHSMQPFCICVNNRDELMRELRQIGIEVQIGFLAFVVNVSPWFHFGE